MDNIVDKVFIINLDSRPDRMNNMVQLMSELHIKNWERFSAKKPHFSKIDKNLYKGYNRYHKLNKKYVKASIGCKLSHLEIIKKAKEQKYAKILILEDDVEFIGNFRHIDIALREVDKFSWDIVYLGMNKLKYEKIDSLVFINKVKDGLCTHSYIIHNRAYNKIINILENSDKQIDLEYKQQFQNNKLNCYCMNNNQFIQNNSYSNINNFIKI